jgi:uncharacterized protein (DUF952 family)
VSDFILHATSRTAWSAAQKSGQYVADSLAAEGFIHCSKASQILRVANSFFAGQHGLVLLVIDLARLTSELRWEPGVDLATEFFPHIYGPINLDAVVDTLDFEPDTYGKFHLPKSLELANH